MKEETEIKNGTSNNWSNVLHKSHWDGVLSHLGKGRKKEREEGKRREKKGQQRRNDGRRKKWRGKEWVNGEERRESRGEERKGE